MYGLSKNELKILKNTISKYPVKKAVIYGSRAIGNYKKGSDIDIVLFGDKELKDKIFYIYDELEEKLPYFIDISLYNFIKNQELKQHIDSVGKVFYEKVIYEK